MEGQGISVTSCVVLAQNGSLAGQIQNGSFLGQSLLFVRQYCCLPRSVPHAQSLVHLRRYVAAAVDSVQTTRLRNSAVSTTCGLLTEGTSRLP
jgi:hypothetical protein